MTERTAILRVCISLAAAVSSACSYHGAIRRAALTDPAISNSGDEPRILLSNRSDGVREIEFTVYAVTFNYETKEGFLDAASTIVESVGEASAPEREPSPPQIGVPHLQATTLSSTQTSAVIEVESKIDIIDSSSERVLRTYRATRQANYSNPASASALGFLTGLSLFTLAPITLTAAIQIEGNHGRDVLEIAIRESLSDIHRSLAQDAKRDDEAKLIGACVRKAVDDPALRSLRDDVALDSVESQTFDMLASEARPSDEEKAAIRNWSELVSSCFAEQEAFMTRWNVPPALRALSSLTKSASQNLRVLLFSGAITYGEYARRRQEIQDAFEAASAEIEAELAEQSAAASARAELLAMEAQKVNLASIQARQAEAQTLLMGIQTINQSTAIVQQQQQHQQLLNQLNRPKATFCNVGRYSVSCSSW